MIRKVAKTLSEFNKTCLNDRFLELILLMTSLMLLLYMRHTFILSTTLLLFIPAALLFRKLLDSKVFWILLSVLMIAGFARIWHSADNHTYLAIYWVLAITLCTFSANRSHAISFNARILIGLCFFFATLWKFLSPEFTDGTFFYFTFLTDSRFFEFAELTAGVDAGMRSHNLLVYNVLNDPMGRSVAGGFESTPLLLTISVFMVWWTIFIEGWIALAFLAPLSAKISNWRDIPLIIFMITTYPIATVSGFASLLAVMGFAQCRESNSWMRPVYLAIFIAVPLFNLPYLSVLLDLLY